MFKKPGKLQNKFLKEIICFFELKIVHTLAFIIVNVVIGSLGIWMPILASVVRPDLYSFDFEVKKAFLSGGSYIFAVAYLAASSSYLVYEC